MTPMHTKIGPYRHPGLDAARPGDFVLATTTQIVAMLTERDDRGDWQCLIVSVPPNSTYNTYKVGARAWVLAERASDIVWKYTPPADLHAAILALRLEGTLPFLGRPQ